MRAHRTEHRVGRLCRALRISRSGFYASARRPQSRRQREDRLLVEAIRRIHEDVDQVYGAPRMHRELVEEGYRCGRHRVARLMHQEGIRARRKRRRHPRTTVTDHALPVAPNVLARRFDSDEPNRVWVGDITYLWTWEGWLFLAVLLDMFSRRVVGWAMDERIDRVVTLRALEMALSQRRPHRGLVHHTDRGCQYASTDYQIELERHGITCSMSRKGNCYDNAVSESFFASLKRELAQHRRWVSRHQARADVFHYIEAFYNRRRRHSALGYRSPVAFEEARVHATVSVH